MASPSAITSRRRSQSALRVTMGAAMLAMAVIGPVFLGCEPERQLTPVPGPLTLDQAMARYNVRVSSIPAFRAKIQEWEITYHNEPDQTVHHKDMYGHVFYHPPAIPGGFASCYIEARTLLDPELTLGCNALEYWMAIKRAKQAHWGKYEHLGQPCAEAMPVHPQLFLELAGLRPLSNGDNETGRPTWKIEPEHNIIQYLKQDENRLWIRQEITIDRRTDLPVAIRIYDPSGKCTLESRITAYDSLDGIGLPGRISLSSGDGDFQFELKLGSYKTVNKDQSQLFIRPKRFAGISDYQQIDRLCENDSP